MSNADEDVLRAMRAASPALQEWWPDGESPRSWAGVTWSDDRVQKLDLSDSKLDWLPPQIGQLLALTTLYLYDCSHNLKQIEMANADEDALRAMRAASPALQEWWPDGASPCSWQGVRWSGDRVQELNLKGSQLEVLSPEIGQLQALTMLDLDNCSLKELPPEIGQLQALTWLSLEDCKQLTLAPGAKVGQPAQTIVEAYTRLLIVEPHKDAPGQLHAYLLAKPLAVPPFFKYIVGDLTGDALLADWLGEAVKATPELAHLTAPDGRSVTDVSEQTRLSRATAKPDEDALRAMRAASPALQEWWPEGESPRSWKGVTWSDDRVQELNFEYSELEVLPPQIGQLRALTTLGLRGCPLKELPPEIGQLLALTNLDLSGSGLKELAPEIGQLRALTKLILIDCPLKELPPEIGQLLALTSFGHFGFEDCEQLTLAPGAEKEGQPAQTIVAAYTRLLIVEPHSDTPGQLHAFLLANPLAVPAFFKSILTDAAHADWLGEAVKATPSTAGLTDADGRRAIDVAHSACKQAMQAALFLLGRFDVDDGPLLHVSATAAVAAAADHGDPEAKPAPRVALKAMRGVKQDSAELEVRAGAEQVCAELKGRVGLDPKRVVAVKAVYADEKAIAGAGGAEAWQLVKDAADELGVEAEVKPGLSNSIQARFFKKQEVERPSAEPGPPAKLARQPTQGTLDASSKYTYLLVMELADRSLATALMHDRIAANDWPLVRKMGGDLARGLDNLHVEGGRIHADFKPLNICRVPEEQDNFTTFFDWALIDFDVSCLFGKGFGSKLPSSGYCPPEMAEVFLKATDPNTGVLVNKEEFSVYKADVAYDLWSFGAVLFHLGTGKSLWHTNQDDSISQADLRKLASWDRQKLKMALLRFSRGKDKTKDEVVLQHLVGMLLEPRREQRLKNFESEKESEMQMVLQHPFFDAKSLDDATLQKVSDQIKEVGGKLDVVIEMGLEHRIELQHTRQVLLKGIFEATEVLMPTTFIILDEELQPELSADEQDQLFVSLNDDGSGIELSGDAKVAKGRFDKGTTWLKRLQAFGEGVIENNPSKVFGKIKEVLGDLVTKDKMYFYLVDELTGLPVRGASYPIVITTPSEVVHKLLPMMQVGMRAMSLYNGVAGVAQMVGYPFPKVSEQWRKGAQSSVEMLKQESSVEKFGAVHAKVKEGDDEEETTRGASLRELQRFFKEHDKDEGYAGLRRIADEDGTAVWTILKETEVMTQLEKRAGERREEERRHEKIFSAQARVPSEATDTAWKEAEARWRTELEAAHEKTEAEAKARGEAEAKLRAKLDKEETEIKTNNELKDVQEVSVQMGQGAATGAAAGASMATTSVEIVVPEGCFAGSEITVEWGGKSYTITVPDGVTAGQLLKTELPALGGETVVTATKTDDQTTAKTT